MSTALLEPPVRNWKCPSCQTVDRTQRPDAHTQMHLCNGLRGLLAPLVEVRGLDDRADARHVEVMREDYVGQAGVSPTASVRTDHGDGSNDVTVFAPLALGSSMAPPPAMGVGVHPHQARATAEGFDAPRYHHRFHDPKLARWARMARDVGLQMAWSTSNVNAYYVYAMGTNAVKPSTDAFSVALFGSGVTPAQSTTESHTEYANAAGTWTTGNESSGTGYTAGGVSVSSPTWTQASNVVTFTSAGTPQWTTASFTAYGGLVYDTTVSNLAISWNYFGGQQTVTAGTFTVAWNASGIAAFTC